MDFLLSAFYVLVPIALARHSLGLKPEYQNKLDVVDKEFSKYVIKFSSLELLICLEGLGNIIRFLTVLLFALFLLVNCFFSIRPDDGYYFLTSLMLSLLCYGAIIWYTKFREFSIPHLKDLIVISFLPILLPFIDIFFDSNFTYSVYDYSQKHFYLARVIAPDDPSVIVLGMIISVAVTVCLVTSWIISSVVMAFVFLPICILIYSMLKFCKYIEVIMGERSLNGFLVLILAATQWYSWYK